MKACVRKSGRLVVVSVALSCLCLMSACGGNGATESALEADSIETARRRPGLVKHFIALRTAFRSVSYASEQLEDAANGTGATEKTSETLYAEPVSTFQFSEAEIFACPESGNIRYAVAGEVIADYLEESVSFEAAGKIVFDDCQIPESPYSYKGQLVHHRTSDTSADYRTISTQTDGGLQNSECIVDFEDLVREKIIDVAGQTVTSSFTGQAYVFCFDQEVTLRCDFDASRPFTDDENGDVSFEPYCQVEDL